jgi:hypothetical protein
MTAALKTAKDAILRFVDKVVEQYIKDYEDRNNSTL